MVFALGLSSELPIVLGVAAAAPILTTWQGVLVVKSRKASGIQYPQMYATKEEEQANAKARVFNCVQRAHQNTIENLSQFYVSLLIAGLEFPRFAAAAGAIWLVGRIFYTTGYATGTPKKRLPGGYASSFALIANLGASLVASYNLFRRSGVKLF